MARSLASISKRSKTIKTTMKITNAMKLVSLSKLQKYRQLAAKFTPLYEYLLSLASTEPITVKKGRKTTTETIEKEILYVIFTPDLGLVASYTRELMQFITELQQPNILLIGTKGYDELSLNTICHVVNDKMNGEHGGIEKIIEVCQSYQDTYKLVVVTAEVQLSSTVAFHSMEVEKTLDQPYNRVFEPSYDIANAQYQEMLLKCLLVQSYYECKISEYMLRRVAMEKATESADGMLYDLQLQFNRLRQEKITEEIADLMSEEEDV